MENHKFLINGIGLLEGNQAREKSRKDGNDLRPGHGFLGFWGYSRTGFGLWMGLWGMLWGLKVFPWLPEGIPQISRDNQEEFSSEGHEPVGNWNSLGPGLRI